MSQSRWRPIYERVAPILVVMCLLASLFASVGTYWGSRVNSAQDRARTADNTRLLACFDDFASALAGGLPPVRKATAATNTALAAAMAELRAGLVKVGAGTFTGADLNRLIDAFAAYQEANDHLEQVRAANPYPPAPSTFCPADS